jgi:hypothetical protein
MTMTHLSPGQLVDLAEGAAPAGHVAHAASCETCRAHADALRDVLRQAASDTVPEPSPLFWEHLAARVGAAVREEPAPRAAWTIWTWRWAPMTAVAVLALAVGLGTSLWKGPPREHAIAGGPSAPSLAGALATETDDDLASQDDPSWNLMRELSSDVVFDDDSSSELPAVPGLVDRALRQLTDPERAELAKILRAELTRPSAAGPKRTGDSSAS